MAVDLGALGLFVALALELLPCNGVGAEDVDGASDGAEDGVEDGAEDVDGAEDGAEVGHVPGVWAMFTIFAVEPHP